MVRSLPPLTEEKIYQLLATIEDPELAPVTMAELGMIAGVRIEENKVLVPLLPTYVGCPAFTMLAHEVERVLKPVVGERWIQVVMAHDPPWSSQRITAEGRRKLVALGIAPPPLAHEPGAEWLPPCPFCGSAHTRRENHFGSTACRSLFYCYGCNNPFEGMKP